MKRAISAILIALLLLFCAGCRRITINKNDEATLNFSGNDYINDERKIAESLSDEETETVRAILAKGKYLSTGAACPFYAYISISFGEQVFAISLDDCESVKEIATGNCYLITKEGKQYIMELFEKYVGYIPTL